jgi:chromate transport protein ChrA
MLLSILLQPQLHGSVGILDELLVYCLPLMVLVIILSIASRRARKQSAPRERTRADKATPPIQENSTSAKDRL